jgi:hypothetical protein
LFKVKGFFLKNCQVLLVIFCFCISCKQNKNILPSSTGKTGELLIVCENDFWNSVNSEYLKSAFEYELPGLPRPEPAFSIIHIPEDSFRGLFKTHHSILMINNNSSEQGISYKKDAWSTSQFVIKVNASGDSALQQLIKQNLQALKNLFEQEERRRLTLNYSKIRDKKIEEKIETTFDLTMIIPEGFFLASETKDFVWMRRETSELSQGIIIYSRPYSGKNQFEKEYILDQQDYITLKNIPGTLNGSFMATDRLFPTDLNSTDINGNYALEMRGLWKVKGDFMGGPFLSYSIYDTKKNRIITAVGYVYAPRFEKRDYLKQLEAILFSITL